jgi:D-inositol-3-phosphate glycosyltransferase
MPAWKGGFAVRVAFVAYHTSPLASPGVGDAGGMNVYVSELALGLARLGVEVDIFTRQTRCDDETQHLHPCARVVPIPAGPRGEVGKERLTQFLPVFAEGIEAVREKAGLAYDVIHSHYWQSGVVAQQLAEWWNAPLVHTYHTLGRTKNRLLPDGDDPEPQARLEAEEEVLRAADLVTASSEVELAELAEQSVALVRPGVDHELFHAGDRALARRRLGLGDAPMMLAVGRIQRLKGLELAVRALPLLGRAPFLLVAGGPSGADGGRELGRLDALARRLGVRGRIRFLGPQPRAELPDLYRAADVAVVCSHSESFGFTALEAQACGTPVVATPVGAIPEIVRDGVSGYVLEHRSPGDLAERLRRLFDDRSLHRRFGEAAVRSAGRYRWDDAAGELRAAYRALVRERVLPF